MQHRPLKVCPPQGRQLKDIYEEDLFEDFRICDTYRGGGGYDQFPNIARKRGLIHEYTKGNIGKQFVVQLYGCHLRCPYCYVTRDGIYGSYTEYYLGDLFDAYDRAQKKHDVGVFHMMGGAPALWMERWAVIPMNLAPFNIFHSDFLLTEKSYDPKVLYNLNTKNSLYAVNIKGVTREDYRINTGRSLDHKLFYNNMEKILKTKLNFYLTFTNPDLNYIDEFNEDLISRFGEGVLQDSFIIDLKKYDALEKGKAW